MGITGFIRDVGRHFPSFYKGNKCGSVWNKHISAWFMTYSAYFQLYSVELVANRIRNVVCFLLGNSPASGVYMPTFRNTLSVPSS